MMMDYDKMEAGREMDALVDETIFGVSERPYYGSPDYSTDIAAAWDVVEKMQRLGFWFDFHGSAGSRKPHYYGCAFHPLSVLDADKPLAGVNSAPLAICRAALKALAT